MKHIAIILVAVISLFSCKADHASCEFAGTYSLDSEAGLILRVDRSFTIIESRFYCVGGEDVQDIVSGSFSTRDDKIFLSPTSYHIVRHNGEFRNRKVLSDSTCDVTSVHKNVTIFKDTLQVLRWDHRMYILGADRGVNATYHYSGYSNDIIELLNVYNSDPESIHNYGTKQHIVARFWNKPCADCTEDDFTKMLPAEWSPYALQKPIETRIVSLNEINNDRVVRYIATLDVGSASNVKPGMKFYPMLAKSVSDGMTITGVSTNSAKGTISIVSEIRPEVGAKLTTFAHVVEDSLTSVVNP